jgi:hypothetical protein
MATKQELWVVVNVKTLNISIDCQTETSANTAARLLAVQNPGHEYAVLRSVRSFKQEPPQPTEYDHGDYPF